MWAKHLRLTKCQRCGTSERPHKGRGMCAPCFYSDRYECNAEYRKATIRRAKERYRRVVKKQRKLRRAAFLIEQALGPCKLSEVVLKKVGEVPR